MPNQILAVLCVMYLILYIDRVNLATLAPKMTVDLGLSNTQFGLAVSAFAYPYAFIQLFGSWLSDRLGARRMLLLSGAIVVAATMLTGLVGGLASLVAVRVALGFGEGFAFPTATRAMAVWMPASRWGFAQGVTHAAARIANAITPPLIVGILAYVGWRGTFVVLGFLSLIWVVLWAFVARDNPREHPGVTPAELELLASNTQSTGEGDEIPWWRLARRIAPVTAVDSATAGRSGCS